ncbi:hypothetical protein M422DRAFT_107587, partial [Sphaerobolus stellatus SS14]
PSKPDMSAFRPPKSSMARLRWRWSMWVGGTFASSMLESWECFVLVSVFGFLLLLLMAGVYRYVPRQTAFLAKRVHYYFVGTE